MSDTSLSSAPLPDETNEQENEEVAHTSTTEKSQQSTQQSDNSLVRQIKAVHTQIETQQTLDLIDPSSLADEIASDEAPLLEKTPESPKDERPSLPMETLDNLENDSTDGDFHQLPQRPNSEKDGDSSRDSRASNIQVIDQTAVSKETDINIVSQATSPQTSHVEVLYDRSEPASEQSKKLKIRELDDGSSNSSKGSSRADSISARVQSALKSQLTPSQLGISAADSIEVKSVSSTSSSKYATEVDRFQRSSIWKFVKQYMSEDQQKKMMTDMSSSSGGSLQTRSKTLHSVNTTGKSGLSEQRFVDGLYFSPMGSHKSSTPDHSLISGWKNTESESGKTGSTKQEKSASSGKARTNTSYGQNLSRSRVIEKSSERDIDKSKNTSRASSSADDLSNRVRKLLQQIDNSLEEKSLDLDPIQQLPKLATSGLVNANSEVNSSPRSMEDLTSDERFGSFMPPSKSPDSLKSATGLAKPRINATLTEEKDFDSTLEEGEIRETLLEMTQETPVYAQSRQTEETIRRELEIEQQALRNSELIDDSQPTLTSQMHSEDKYPPAFPQEAFGTAERDSNELPAFYQKDDTSRVELRPLESSISVNSTTINAPQSTRINVSPVKLETTNQPATESIFIRDEATPRDSVRVLDKSAMSQASSILEWYPKSMREFKELPKDKKQQFITLLRKGTDRRRNASSSSSASFRSAVSLPNQKPVPAPSSSAERKINNQQQGSEINEERITEKILNSLETNIRTTIQTEIAKIKPQVREEPQQMFQRPKLDAQIEEKENWRQIFQQSPKLTPREIFSHSSTRSFGPRPRVEDIEAEIEDFKIQEKIVDEVKICKAAMAQNKKAPEMEDEGMVSFCNQVDENEIISSMKDLHKRLVNGESPERNGKASSGTQTREEQVKNPSAWYCPVYTGRKVPIDRNALDSTKRLAENAWQRASLQEAVLIHKQEFISSSRARVRHVKLRKEQRFIEKELDDQRRKIFGVGTYTDKQRAAKIHPLADKFFLQEKRQINLREARKETTERYNKLPEVRGKREDEKTNRKKVENQIKTKVFAKKIQRQVLNQL
ncbi:unnamed protein product [Oikopleura dioica]|uniref:ALMS motif domain-containing protein n=1 Tax=Oikopleura dioica TaxID=34765 RepID=E4YI97_OIKDI|nr:unnamed protein product [Oikopleura dioica]